MKFNQIQYSIRVSLVIALFFVLLSVGFMPPIAAQSCDWSGWWETSKGDMQLQQSGGIVTGTYGGWGGSIQGNASGNKLIGTYTPTGGYGGDIEFNMSDDCKSFSGRSRSYGDWGNWTGTRILKRVVSENLISDYYYAQFGYPSPDCTRIAYTNSTPEGGTIVVAGPGGKSEGMPHIIEGSSKRFSPDSKRLAYMAYVGDKRVAVVDGVEGKAYDDIPHWGLTFSPDSQHIAYRAKSCDNGTCKWVMVLDGVEQPYYGNVDSEPVFSPPELDTGKTHIAYEISTQFGQASTNVVADGKMLEPAGNGPIFSPDGKRLAYSHGEPVYIVLDGVRSRDLGEKNTEVWFVYSKYFSPDSKRFVYDGCPNGCYSGSHVIISDIGRSNIYCGNSDFGPVVFSPDSKHFAYRAFWNNSWKIFLDDKDGKGYNWGVGDPIFSPDSKHMAYIAQNDNGKFVVLDGNEGKNYSEVWALTISPDSKRIAYVARDDKDGGKQFVVVDGREGKRYSVKIKWGPFFSPDSKHVVYVTNNCYQCSFKELVVVDEVEEKLPYNVVAGIVFDSNSTFHYLATTTYQTYLIEESLGETEAALVGTEATGPQATSTFIDKLVGDWIMQGKQTGVENSDFKAVLTLKADGTLSWLQTAGANVGATRTGTWEFDGASITMKWLSPKGGLITWSSSSVGGNEISDGTYTAELVSGGTWSASR